MDSISVAFRLNGGLGDVLIQINYIKCFYEFFRKYPISVYVFGTSSAEINDCLLNGQCFITGYYTDEDIFGSDFDLVVDIRLLCRIVSYNQKTLSNLAPELYSYVMMWINFESDPKTAMMYSHAPMADHNIYSLALIRQKTRMNLADVDGRLGMGNEFQVRVETRRDEDEYLRRLNLVSKKFITLHRGFDGSESISGKTLLWPIEYYDRLVYLIRERYPEYKLVQFGNMLADSPVNIESDRIVFGKLSLGDELVLLKHSALHIDGDCGLVYLRKVLGGGTSIVLFGPTSPVLSGCSNNINLRCTDCPEPCAFLTDSWQRKCLLDYRSKCMSDLDPERVMTHVVDYFDNSVTELSRSMSPAVALLSEKLRIDRVWYDNWLAVRTLFCYEHTRISLSKLRCQYYDGGKWNTVILEKHPAYQYLCDGNWNDFGRLGCSEDDRDDVGSRNDVESLFSKLDAEGYDEKSGIILNGKYKIIDGVLRCCWLLHKCGPDHVISAINIYGNWPVD